MMSEEAFNEIVDGFEYIRTLTEWGSKNIKQHIQRLQQENKHQKEVIDEAVEYLNKYESIKAYYEYIDEDGYDEYNYDEDFKKELLDILKEVSE